MILIFQLQSLAQVLQLQKGGSPFQATGAQHVCHHPAVDISGALQPHRRQRLGKGEHLLGGEFCERTAIKGRRQLRQIL